MQTDADLQRAITMLLDGQPVRDHNSNQESFCCPNETSGAFLLQQYKKPRGQGNLTGISANQCLHNNMCIYNTCVFYMYVKGLKKSSKAAIKKGNNREDLFVLLKLYL